MSKNSIITIVNYTQLSNSPTTVGELQAVLAKMPADAKLKLKFSSGHGEYADVIFMEAEVD